MSTAYDVWISSEALHDIFRHTLLSPGSSTDDTAQELLRRVVSAYGAMRRGEPTAALILEEVLAPAGSNIRTGVRRFLESQVHQGTHVVMEIFRDIRADGYVLRMTVSGRPIQALNSRAITEEEREAIARHIADENRHAGSLGRVAELYSRLGAAHAQIAGTYGTATAPEDPPRATEPAKPPAKRRLILRKDPP